MVWVFFKVFFKSKANQRQCWLHILYTGNCSFALSVETVKVKTSKNGFTIKIHTMLSPNLQDKK